MRLALRLLVKIKVLNKILKENYRRINYKLMM